MNKTPIFSRRLSLLRDAEDKKKKRKKRHREWSGSGSGRKRCSTERKAVKGVPSHGDR